MRKTINKRYAYIISFICQLENCQKGFSMKGTLIGFNHVSGTKKDGSTYSFHKFYFKIPTPDSGKGEIVEAYSTSKEEIVTPLLKAPIPCQCYFSAHNGYLLDPVDFIK